MISSLDQKKATGTKYNNDICDLELAQRLKLFVHAQEEETGFTNSLISLIFLISDELQRFQEILSLWKSSLELR